MDVNEDNLNESKESRILMKDQVDEELFEKEILDESNRRVSRKGSQLGETSESVRFSALREDEIAIVEYTRGSEAVSVFDSVFDRFKQCDVMGNKRLKTVLVTHDNVPTLAINKLKEKMKVITVGANDKQEDILEKSLDVDAVFLVGHNVKLDRDMLDFIGDRLKVVGLMSSGYNNVNVRELTSRNIKIGTTRKVIADSVAELAVCLAIAVAHRFKQGYLSWTQKDEPGKHDTNLIIGLQLAGSVCGIIGYSDIAASIATRLVPFRVKRILYKSHRKNVEVEKTESATLAEVLLESDFIFAACPLTEKTQHLFNYNMFNKMKRTCVFINVGESGVVKTNDLVRALNERLIWGAGLDATDPEPLPPLHPLLHLDNCLVSPHIGSATLATREEMALVTADNILAAMEQSPMPGEVCFKQDLKLRKTFFELKQPMRFFAQPFLSIDSHYKYSAIRNM